MRELRVSSASPHPLPPFRASLCRSAASGHLVRARAPLAPPPSRRVSLHPPQPPSPAWSWCGFLSRDPRRKTSGPVLASPCSLGPSGRGGASLFPPPWPPGPSGNSRSWPVSPWDWENRRGMANRFRDPGLYHPLVNLAFLRQEGNQRSRFPRPHPLAVNFAQCGGRAWVSCSELLSYCYSVESALCFRCAR